MKTIKVTFWGGYHNVSEISLRVPVGAYADFSFSKDLSVWAYNNLSKYQIKRLDKHFCGIKGCLCGSFEHANFTAI